VFARRANSAACTLIAALAAVVAVESFVVLVFKPHGLGTFRGMLLLLSLVFMAGALRLRERWRSHAVQLVNAAGLTALVLGATYLVAAAVATAVAGVGGRAFPFLTHVSSGFGAPFGWKLYLLAVGFGLVAYAAVDRERGPAYIGLAVLVVFVLLVGLPSVNRGSLVGWPLFLLVIGAAGLVVGRQAVGERDHQGVAAGAEAEIERRGVQQDPVAGPGEPGQGRVGERPHRRPVHRHVELDRARPLPPRPADRAVPPCDHAGHRTEGLGSPGKEHGSAALPGRQ